MLLFKACPRCEGDMHVSGDIYGDYKECLMCGLMVDIAKDDDVLTVVARKSDHRKKEKAA